MSADRAHPTRLAPTLAVRDRMLANGGDRPAPTVSAGSADARIDLKLLLFRARRALAGHPDADALARFAMVDEPDLLSGAVQDGTARGVMAVLEDAISLCQAIAPTHPEDAPVDDDAQCFEGRDLRRKKDILVASGGSRVRWSRKGGVLFVDREHDVHAEDSIRFEDRADRGDLDGFVADPDERARLFSPGYLKPVRLTQGSRVDQLVLEGRLGRTAQGFPCRVDFVGNKAEPFVRMVVRVRNDHDDHRLRVRFLGCRRPDAIASDGTPEFAVVHQGHTVFVAATLVRACGWLAVGDTRVAVPGAQCRGWHRHEFRLGGTSWSASPTP